jgi:CubicO group peptidase (beta-lactamase class C family)
MSGRTFLILTILLLLSVLNTATSVLYAQDATRRMDALRKALVDTSVGVRTRAALELASLGSEAISAMPELLRALIDPDVRLRDAAQAAVQNIGASAVPALVHAFSDDDPYVNGAAANAIARLGVGVVPPLLDALRTNEPQVRQCAAIALSHMGADAAAATPGLTRALDDSSELVRWTCCYALRNIGPRAREAVGALLRRTHDSDYDVRRASVLALEAIDPIALRTPPSRERIITTVDTLVPRLMKTLNVPGVAVAIIYDRSLAWSNVYGTADVRSHLPVTPQTMFEACSMTKPVFAYTVLKLVEEGRIDLDRPLVEYVAELFPVDRMERAAITARMVLTHTTGFPNWRKGEEARDGPLPVVTRPGSRFGYSGEGMYFLQQAIEHILGEPLESYASRTLFRPLGMAHTSYVWTEAVDRDLAAGHKPDGSFLRKTRYVHGNAAYTLYTSARDYARFVCEILKLDRSAPHSLSAGMLRNMVSRQVSLTTRDPVIRPGRALGSDVFWGLGWSINATPEGDLIHHGGANGSGFRCFVQFHPGEGTGIVIMTNGINGGDLWEQVIREVGDL